MQKQQLRSKFCLSPEQPSILLLLPSVPFWSSFHYFSLHSLLDLPSLFFVPSTMHLSPRAPAASILLASISA